MLHRKSKLFFLIVQTSGYIFLHTCNRASCNGPLCLVLMIIAYFTTAINFPPEFQRFLISLIWKICCFHPAAGHITLSRGSKRARNQVHVVLLFCDHYSACRGFSPAVPWGFSERPIHSAGAFWCCFAANAILKATVKWHRLILSWVKTMKQGRGLFQCTQ